MKKIKDILINAGVIVLGILWYAFCLFLSALPVAVIVLIVLKIID